MTAAEYRHLEPVVYQWFPDDVAEFRALHQVVNPRAPLRAVGEARAAGLARMTDDEVLSLAAALRAAYLQRPSEVDRLWAIVCARSAA
ncbi:hypothetical protein [Deinococcus apachensis]|uniref:hypothetical protein n=1 Tax=Deinococcus apachensis TaxID=309886 RepID=UPI00037C05FD|nr:hypothetical protein [Deinococcus apachensis]